MACALLLVGGLRAGEPAEERHAKTLAPYLDDGTYLVVRVAPARIDLNALFQRINELGAAEQLQQARAITQTAKDALASAGASEAFLVLNWHWPLDQVLFVIPCEKDMQPLLKLLEQVPNLRAQAKGTHVVAGVKGALESLQKLQPQPVPLLSMGFSAVPETKGVQAVFMPPSALRKALAEIFPRLPVEMGGMATAPLAQGFLWAAVGADLGETLGLQAFAQLKDAKTAGGIAESLRQTIQHVARDKDVKLYAPEFVQSADRFVPTVKGDRVVWDFQNKDLMTILLPLAQKSRQAAQRSQSMNNLKQIALAMHSYADVYKGFPPAQSYDAKGKPLLSWRVHVLPFLDHAPLYQEFRLNEPWDSEHNKKLIARMPAVFRSPEAKLEDGKTTYLVPVGKKTIFGGKKSLHFSKITDGTSQTILVVDATQEKAVTWTQPADFDADAKDLHAILVGPGRPGFLAALADGSVRFLSREIRLEQIRAYLSANGGEVIERD